MPLRAMFKTILWASALCSLTYPLLGETWTKNYNVGAAPEVRVDTSDANVTISTSSSRTIEARVITSGWKIGPGDVRITDRQSGDRVELEVKVPNLHFGIGNRWIRIELQVPGNTRTDVRTGDGNIRADGLHAPAKLVTHDGNIEGEDFEGALEASSGDGHIRVRGKFDGLSLSSGDGSIDAEVRPGSRMTSGWSVHTGDGHVTLRLPENFAANVEAHTGDGRITMDLPITTSGGLHENYLNGKLNGGGPTLTIHTGDGSIHLARL